LDNWSLLKKFANVCLHASTDSGNSNVQDLLFCLQILV